jgi:hypothetical protein
MSAKRPHRDEDTDDNVLSPADSSPAKRHRGGSSPSLCLTRVTFKVLSEDSSGGLHATSLSIYSPEYDETLQERGELRAIDLKFDVLKRQLGEKEGTA